MFYSFYIKPLSSFMRAFSCLVCILTLRAPVSCLGQHCGIPGSSPIGTAGLSVRWPHPNPELVAPVFIRHNYQPYSHPLNAEFTGNSITVTIPPDFVAGFSLVNSSDANSTNATEQYRLRSIELRKPGQMPAGIRQVLAHVFELAMVHEETTGTGYWANVVVPFELSAEPDAQGDALSALVENSQLPKVLGEVQPVGMGSSWTLDLTPVWQAAFSQYWVTLPGLCPGTQVATRQFMRNETMLTLHSTFRALGDALEHVVPNVPDDAPQVTWLMGACQEGASCTPLQGHNLSGEIQNLTQTQAEAVTMLRQRRTEMDNVLNEVSNSTVNGSDRVLNASAMYNVSLVARQNLLNAEAALDSVTQSLHAVQAVVNSTSGAIFDGSIPNASQHVPVANTSVVSSVPVAHVDGTSILPSSVDDGSSSGTSNSTASANATATGTNASALVATHAHTSPAAATRSGTDCRALGLSPAAITTKHAVNPETVAKYVKEPIRFTSARTVTTQVTADGSLVTADGQEDELAHKGSPLRLHNNGGEHLRVTVPLDADLALGGPHIWPFGALISSDEERRISYVEVHVPGEHEIDGVAAAAEIQLVHLPVGNASSTRPAVAVALLLDEVPEGSNPWIEPLLRALPAINEDQTVQGEASLVSLHPAMHRGTARHYFRYDGTLTRVPCRRAEWYIVREHGTIAGQQLSALRRVLPHAEDRPPTTFTPSGPVAEGVQSFIEVTEAPGGRAPPASLRTRFRRAHTHRDEIQNDVMVTGKLRM